MLAVVAVEIVHLMLAQAVLEVLVEAVVVLVQTV
jgi:hypothetical protein